MSNPEVLDRVRLAFPDQKMKFIVILREPIARAYSTYDMAMRRGMADV